MELDELNLSEEQLLILGSAGMGLEKWKRGELNEMWQKWHLMEKLERVGKLVIDGFISEEVLSVLYPLQDLKDFTREFLESLEKEVEKHGS